MLAVKKQKELVKDLWELGTLEIRQCIINVATIKLGNAGSWTVLHVAMAASQVMMEPDGTSIMVERSTQWIRSMYTP